MQTPILFDYSRLIPIWRAWLEQNEPMPLDKWLKTHLRDFLASSTPRVKKPATKTKPAQTHFPTADAAAVSHAMFTALRFLQLACACEVAYREQTIIHDWTAWDLEWKYHDARKLTPAACWYWIALRFNFPSAIAAPQPLSDGGKRANFFESFAKKLRLSEAFADQLLWQGMRPQWLALLNERKMASHWSAAQLQEFITQQTTSPPLWLRVQKQADVSELFHSLRDDGVHITLTTEQCLFAQGGTGITTTRAYQQGFIEIQDLASQQIALAVNVKPGQKVWDACAGAGGKTLAIATRMNNKGAIIATDLHAYKLDELKRRAKRAEIHNLRSFTWSGAEPLRLPKEIAQQQGLDWVLVDAPCSSSGTWRRNPDARWRFSSIDSEELIHLQRQILTNAAPAVRSGGYLVYATCSWQVSENETQVEWFLRQCPQFSLISQTMLGTPQQNADAMFVAVMHHAVR